MALNPATHSTRNSTILFRLVSLSRNSLPQYGNQTRFLANTTNGFRSSYVCNSYSVPMSFGKERGFKNVGRSEMGFGRLGSCCFRSRAVSDGGSGGSGGFGGSGGDGGFGGKGEGGGGGDGGKNWSLLSWYLALLEKYPVMTKAVTSATLTLIGDLICQVAINQVSSLDLKRTFLITLLGLVMVGPTLHFWYLYLSKLVTLQGGSGALLRLVLDQFIFAPVFIGAFLSTLLTLEGRPQEVIPKLQQEWVSSVLANWQLWLPFQFLNFRFIPQQFQVLAANVVSLAWNVIISFKAHKEVLPK